MKWIQKHSAKVLSELNRKAQINRWLGLDKICLYYSSSHRWAALQNPQDLLEGAKVEDRMWHQKGFMQYQHENLLHTMKGALNDWMMEALCCVRAARHQCLWRYVKLFSHMHCRTEHRALNSLVNSQLVTTQPALSPKPERISSAEKAAEACRLPLCATCKKGQLWTLTWPDSPAGFRFAGLFQGVCLPPKALQKLADTPGQ